MTGTRLAQILDRNPSYISKIEREELPPPGEFIIRKMAEIFDQEPETLLLMADKFPASTLEILKENPAMFNDLIKTLKNAPNSELKKVIEIAKQVRDGRW